jgi:isoleucyl-tRNA synthetase
MKNMYALINRLSELGLINVNMRLKTKRIAPDLRNNLPKVVGSFENENKNLILKYLTSTGKYLLKYDARSFEIVTDDIELTYSPIHGYTSSESESRQMIVFIETVRSPILVIKGFVKDLARNLQELRKEKGFLPADVLSSAIVSNLNELELNSLEKFKDDLAFLIRAKMVEFCTDKPDGYDFKEIEIDGRKILISIKR